MNDYIQNNTSIELSLSLRWSEWVQNNRSLRSSLSQKSLVHHWRWGGDEFFFQHVLLTESYFYPLSVSFPMLLSKKKKTSLASLHAIYSSMGILHHWIHEEFHIKLSIVLDLHSKQSWTLPLGVQEYRMIKIYSTDSSSQLLNWPTNLKFQDVLPPPSILSESYQLCQLYGTTQKHLFSCMITTPRIMPESYPTSTSNHE